MASLSFVRIRGRALFCSLVAPDVWGDILSLLVASCGSSWDFPWRVASFPNSRRWPPLGPAVKTRAPLRGRWRGEAGWASSRAPFCDGAGAQLRRLRSGLVRRSAEQNGSVVMGT